MIIGVAACADDFIVFHQNADSALLDIAFDIIKAVKPAEEFNNSLCVIIGIDYFFSVLNNIAYSIRFINISYSVFLIHSITIIILNLV